jgi:uncharacterized protein involved in exopolysaccharide biosynthesis
MLRHIVRHRKLTVAIPLVLFTALGLCLNAFTPPVYRATVRIEFPRPADRTPWTGQTGESGGYQSENQSFYTTAELITSRALLGRLARTLSPDEMGQVLGTPAAGATAWLFSLMHADGMFADVAAAGAGIDPAASARERLELAITGLGTMVSVEPLRDTRLVDLKSTSARATKRWISPIASRGCSWATRSTRPRSRTRSGSPTSRSNSTW